MPRIDYKWRVLATIMLQTSMNTLDASITNIAFPTLVRVFDRDISAVIWVALIYILVSTSLMLVLGRLGDLFGRKNLYVTGSALFACGLAACASAPTLGALIAFRALQAVGSAMSVACGPAIITETFPAHERGKGLGLVGVSVSMGFILGPILGGLLLGWLGWRSIFWVQVPLGALAVTLGATQLKKDRPQRHAASFDLAGTALSFGFIACLILGVSLSSRFGLASGPVLGLLAVSLGCLAAFIVAERRSSNPIVDLSLFAHRPFGLAALGLNLAFIAYPGVMLVMPFFLIDGLGLNSSAAGLHIAIISMATIVLGPISGWLSDRWGAARFSTLGALITLTAFIVFTRFGQETTRLALAAGMALMGVGVGMFQPPNNSTIMGSVPKHRLGTASALIGTLRQVGISLGMAVASTIYAASLAENTTRLAAQGLTGAPAQALATSQAFHASLVLPIVLLTAVAGLSMASGLGKRPVPAVRAGG